MVTDSLLSPNAFLLQVRTSSTHISQECSVMCIVGFPPPPEMHVFASLVVGRRNSLQKA